MLANINLLHITSPFIMIIRINYKQPQLWYVHGFKRINFFVVDFCNIVHKGFSLRKKIPGMNTLRTKR